MSSDFAKCSWHFPHFLVENAAKHKTSMIHCLSPGFPVADQAEAPPDLAASIFPNLLWILLSKTIKIKICHFISFLFHFISLQFCSLRFIHWFIHSFLPSFIPSFLRSFIHSFIHVMGVPARLLWALGCGVPSTLSRKGTLARPMSSCFFTLYLVVFQKKVYCCLLNVEHFFVLRNLECILLHFGIILLFFGSSSKVSFCPLKV